MLCPLQAWTDTQPWQQARKGRSPRTCRKSLLLNSSLQGLILLS